MVSIFTAALLIIMQFKPAINQSNKYLALEFSCSSFKSHTDFFIVFFTFVCKKYGMVVDHGVQYSCGCLALTPSKREYKTIFISEQSLEKSCFSFCDGLRDIHTVPLNSVTRSISCILMNCTRSSLDVRLEISYSSDFLDWSKNRY